MDTFLNDFEIMMKFFPVLRQLESCIYYDSLDPKILETLEKITTEKLLQVENLILKVNSEMAVLEMLPFFEPNKLENLTISEHTDEKEDNEDERIYMDFTEISELDRWNGKWPNIWMLVNSM